MTPHADNTPSFSTIESLKNVIVGYVATSKKSADFACLVIPGIFKSNELTSIIKSNPVTFFVFEFKTILPWVTEN